MWGDPASYHAWQHALRLIQQSEAQSTTAPKALAKNSEQKQRAPSPLKGRKLSAEHVAKLKKPKTEAQRAALRVPKRNSAKMGKYERTAEIRAAASEVAKGRQKTPDEITKIAKAKVGKMNPKYKEFTFAAEHPVYGTFFGERMTLHRMFPQHLPLDELRKLALGEKRSYKGWKVVQCAVKAS